MSSSTPITTRRSSKLITVELTALPGGRFRVSQADRVLIERARDPEHEAARELLKAGHKGPMQTRWTGSQVVAMVLDIETAAARSIRETKYGLTRGKYVPLKNPIT